MRDGKKSVAQKIVYTVFDEIKNFVDPKTNKNIKCSKNKNIRIKKRIFSLFVPDK